MRRCLAATGSARKVYTARSVAFSRVEVALGEAEWAAMQTVHFAASVALEWLWATNATADQRVSSRQKNATFFENNRISIALLKTLLESTPKQEASATRGLTQKLSALGWSKRSLSCDKSSTQHVICVCP